MEKSIKNSITEIVLRAIRSRVFPGCVVGVVRKSGERFVLQFGRFTYDQDSTSVKADSMFDVASITKSIPTACLAIKLIDEKRLNLDDRLVNFVPEFRNSDRENVLIKHLLQQKLDFGFRLSSYKGRSPEDILDVIFTSEFRSKPGRRYSYANATSILLGLVVERVYGKQLDSVAEKIFFKPLGMNKTTFHPNKFSKKEIVPTEIDTHGIVIRGVVHDESARQISKKKIVGSAGLFSTVPDLLIFLEMLINKGAYRQKRYLSQEVVKLMLEEKLGWEFNKARYMGKFCHKQMFGKTGFTGCSVICDPIKGIGIVFLSNYHYPKRKESVARLNAVRKQIADTVLV